MNFSKEDTLGIKIISGAVLVVALISAIAIILGDRPQPDSNNCIAGESYRNVVLLIDNTDLFSDNQKDYIARLEQNLQSDLDVNDRLTIYVMGENSSFSPTPKLSICRPPSGSETNQFISNPRRAQETFEELFSNPVAESLQESQLEQESTQSPIIEFIEGIVSNLTSSNIFEISEFMIVSDLFQNTDQLNQYQVPATSLDRVPEYYQNIFENIGRTNVFRESTKVEISYLIRESIADRQTRRHILFWEQAFDAFGVNLEPRNESFLLNPVR